MLIVILNILPIIREGELKSLDLRLKIKKNIQVSNKIIIARIDDECCSLEGELGAWPWSRKIHAQLLRSVDKFLAPAKVMFDILFIGPSNDKIADIAFARTIKKSGKVYLPYSFIYTNDDRVDITAARVSAVEKPYEPFIEAARGTGFINFQEDSDGRIRRIPLLLKHNNQWFPHIVFKMFLDLNNIILEDLIIRPGRSIQSKDGSVNIPVDKSCQLLLLWPGSWKDTFRHYNCLQIMKMNAASSNESNPEKDNIIIIGDTTTGSVDVRATSVEKRVPLVYANAVLLNQLLTGKYLSESGLLLSIIMSVILGLLIIITAVKNMPAAGIIKNIFLITLYIAASFLLIFLNVHIPLFVPLMIALISIIVSGLYNHIRFKNHVDLKLSFQQKLTMADAKLPQFRNNLKIGDYSDISEVGRGGMAIVYLGKDKKGDLFAIKVINPDHLQKDPTFKIRFKREIYTMKKVSHPNVIKIYDSGSFQGVYYYVMEYFPAGDLSEHMLSLSKVDNWIWLAEFFIKLLEGLKAIHDVGLVHRDIKPANIMMNDEYETRIADFGLAKREDEEHLLTTMGQVMGTPSYLAPELLSPDGKAAPASDIYAMGIVFYEILSGSRPFVQYTTMPQLIRAKVSDEIPPVQKSRAEAPKVLAAIVDKMVRRNVESRFISTTEIIKYLKAYIEKEKRKI